MQTTSEAGAADIKLQPRSAGEFKPGGFWWRALATILDGCILSVFVWPIQFGLQLLFSGMVAGQGETQEASGLMVAALLATQGIQFVAMFFYYGWFYNKKGATPGKMAVGLRVVHAETGTNISYLRAFGRETLGKLLGVLTIFIGFVMAGFTKEKTALHDLAFKTRVLKKVN